MSRIQEGINWNEGSKPRGYFKLLFLKPRHGIETAYLKVVLEKMWQMLQDLKSGVVRDLGAEHTIDPEGLQCLIGFGHRLFDREGITRPMPHGLAGNWRFLSPNDPNGDRRVVFGSGLRYAADIEANSADNEIVLQVTANSMLSVHRVQVEIWKLMLDLGSDEAPPLEIASFFDGFGRADRRSWIDFHDGISNLRKGRERREVVAIKPLNAGDQDWSLDGSYMVFMRLPVSLSSWRKLPEADREIAVGRTLRSGCPLRDSVDGIPVPIPSCPVTGTKEIIKNGNEAFREPPPVNSPLIQQSHVQRANRRHSSHFERPDHFRIYRQGFEFLEGFDASGSFRQGLNFVSFQDDPIRTLKMLSLSTWLGGVNFGGKENHQPPGLSDLISVRAASVCYVPPIEGDGIMPGRSLFP